jgi:hypothetical protein
MAPGLVPMFGNLESIELPTPRAASNDVLPNGWSGEAVKDRVVALDNNSDARDGVPVSGSGRGS